MGTYAFMFMQETLLLYGAERNTILIYLYLHAKTELAVYGASHFTCSAVLTYSAVHSTLYLQNNNTIFILYKILFLKKLRTKICL